mmetsp:Transcript_15234/g.22431  ORF Transcript_15234/g.22431 Transcript_15234/m.22431 type:complete len:273 (-) Transcript_15234:625-1443(-)
MLIYIYYELWKAFEHVARLYFQYVNRATVENNMIAIFVVLLLLSFPLTIQPNTYSGRTIHIDECLKFGFKNTVFTLVNNTYLLIRVGFVTDSNTVLSFRNITMITLYKAAVQSWISETRVESNEHLILKKMVQCESHIENRDMVPQKDLEQEYIFGAQCNTIANIFFGTSGAVQRIIIPLPQSLLIEASVSLAIDFHVRLSGDLRSFKRTMTEPELLHLLYSYYSDQMRFYLNSGTFHVDGHTGNLLLHLWNNNSYYFVGTDSVYTHIPYFS